MTERNDSPSKQEWIDAMMTAFDEAADSVEAWEYGGAESKEDFDLHRNAALEVAKRIRRMAWRFCKKETAKHG